MKTDYNHLGITLLQQGKLQEAEAAFRKALNLEPNQSSIYSNLGVALKEQGKLKEAEMAFRQAIKINSQAIDAYSNLGLLLQEINQIAAAENIFNQAIQINPNHAATYYNLGLNLVQQKKLAEAEAAFKQAIKIKPNYEEAWNNLAIILQQEDKLDQATEVLQSLLKLQPEKGEIYNNLGFIYKQQKKYSKAEEAFKKALIFEPKNSDIYNNLGLLLQEQGQYLEAENLLKEAIKIQPNCAISYNSLGIVYKDQCKLADAENSYRQALKLNPDYKEAYNNLAITLQEQNRLDEAEKAYEQALKIDSDYAQAHFNLGMCLLFKGNYEQGWEKYEWRTKIYDIPQTSQPLWKGENLQGKIILIVAEQGLGDNLQFIRFAPLLTQQGATVKVACQKSLVKLFSAIKGIDKVIAKKSTVSETVDVYLPIMSLPHRLGITLNKLSDYVPYISPPIDYPHQIKTSLNTSLKVGIVWSSEISNPSLYRKKKCPLELLLSLLQINGVSLYSLQVGRDAPEIVPYIDDQRVFDLRPEIIDFTDTAGLINYLDLIIAIDTSVAHLAGAMGKPVWVLLPFSPDWRWLLNRIDTPWYPTMRLFRQPQAGDWETVIGEIGQALGEMVGENEVNLDFSPIGTDAKRDIEGVIVKPEQVKLAKEYSQEGVNLARLGRLEEAEVKLRQAVAIDPLFATAYGNLAVLLKEKGQLEQAEEALRQGLCLEPENPHSHYNLGIFFYEQGNMEGAEVEFRRTLQCDDEFFHAYNNLGVILKNKGLEEEAEKAYRRAIELQDNYPEAYNNLGVLLREKGQLAEAEEACRNALRYHPHYEDAWVNLGIIFKEKDLLIDAKQAYQKAIELNPNNATAYYNLGIILKQEGWIEAAKTNYNQVIQLDSRYYQAYVNLTSIYRDEGEFEQAEMICRRLIENLPEEAAAYNNLGALLKDKGFLDEAIENYNLAITIKPDFADAYNNLGVAYLNKMELSQAEKAYRKAIAIDKNHAQAHFNLGFNLLLRGNYNQGWNEYEWRWQSHEVIFPKLNKPLWQGEDIKGKTILLVTEQGLGDAIQFIRYVPLIRDLGAKVKVDCQASLVELFKTVEGVSEVKSNHQVNEFDVYIPLMTLPRILQTTLATIPNQIPYLAAPKQVYSLPNTSDLKIGIVWATARENFTLYPKKSCSLEFFGRLLGIKGIKFYSLQVGPDREDIKFYQQSITDLSQYIDDFTATAGLISQLDLVISVDTAVAHLAGAMGKPVWLLLPFSPDWRWLCERNDSPWYPTLRLFRQPQPEDWGNVFMNIALELAKWVKDATFKVNLAYFANITPKSLANNLLQKSIKRKTINHQTIIDSLQANFTLAFQHYQARRLQEATRIYRHIISLETLHQDSAFKTTLARAYNNLGAMLIEQKLNSEAETAFENAINLLPNYAEAYYNLGRLFTEKGNFIEAEKQLRQAINLNSKFVDAYIYLGTALKSQGKFAEAVSYLEQALSFKPNSLEIYNNLGIYYHEQGLFPQAEAAFKKAISIQPDFADSHGNLGLQFLLCGDFYQGWAEYEWRLKTEELKVTVIKNKPLWDGSNPRGKTLLLIAEQGLGDTIQFVRYIPILQAMGATVKLVCDATLVELFVPIKGLTEVMAFNTVIQGSDFDFYVYLLSLPQILKTNLETIPQQIPYLHSPCTTYQLPNPSSFNIGFVWSTNKTTPKLYWKKRCKVEHFLQLLDIKNINLYSLQVGEDAVELQPYLQRDRLYDLSSQIKDFTDTAAIIEQLDLIISVDTAVAHLAGAMGKPVWNLLPFIPDWRWLLDRNDSPWYSTMKLFRQTTIGDWESVFSVIRQDLCVKSQKSEFRSQESKKGAINIKKIALSWPISLNSGWGVYGFNLILQLATKKNYQPLLLCPQPHADNCNPLHQYLLSPVFENQYQIQHFLNQPPGQKLALDALILYALGNDFSPSPFAERFQGKRNIGLIFFENTQLSQTALEKAQFYDLIIAGSRWNEEVLRGYGFNHVTTVIQGIDPTIFHPAPKSNLWGERFVIFSGGKLEYRKGQDIIVAAFKRFQQRHPEALLVTAWHNFWPQFMQGLETTGNVIGLPQVAADKRLGIKAWLIDNGIPAESIIDLGLLPNHLMGQILREADVAVFANRCEGGTNLAAMESLACGVPTILSTNTGHLDLVNQIPCYPLKSQKKVKPTALFPGVDGWGESSVEEILIHLETVYQHQQEAQKIGQAAAILMQNLTWEYQVNKLLFAMGLI